MPGTDVAVHDRRWRLILSASVVVFLFAACGAWSSRFYAIEGARTQFVGVPFALVCAALCVRIRRAALIVLAVGFIWPFAHIAAWFGRAASGSNSVGMAVGGLLGGLGITLVVAIVDRPHLLSLFWLAGGGLIGAVAALPFKPWLAHVDFRLNPNPNPDPMQPIRLEHAFAIWQACVGAYIYLASRKRSL